jgi:hypothetical protein
VVSQQGTEFYPLFLKVDISASTGIDAKPRDPSRHIAFKIQSSPRRLKLIFT